MCGRYQLEPEENLELARIIAEMQHDPSLKTCGEIFPGDHVPVLCKSRTGRVRPFAMEWGYHSADGRRIINARSETADQRAMFQESMRLRRCMLPMSAYFEWAKYENKKIKFRIAPEEKQLHYLAGLYRFEGTQPVCTVLTRAASSQIAFIHPRMPVILSAQDSAAWLNGAPFNFMQDIHLRLNAFN